MVPELRFGHEAGAVYVFRMFYNSSLSLLAPMLATIPFAQSFAAERNSGFLRSIMCRMPARRYAIGKLLSAALSGGLVLAGPLLGVLLWATSVYPIVADPNGNPVLVGRLSVEPLAFMWISVGIAFLFGATFSVVGLAGSVFFRSPYYANVVPLPLYIVPALFFVYAGLPYLDPPMMWSPSNNVGTTPATVGGQYAAVLVVSVFLFFTFMRLREE